MGSLALVRQVLSDAKWYQGVEVKYQTEEPSVKRATYNKALKSVDLKSNFYSIARDELDYDRIFSLKNEFRLKFSVYGNGKEIDGLIYLKLGRLSTANKLS